MNTYLVVKWIHVLSSVLMVGTGFGSAVYLFFANRWGDLKTKQFVTRMVVFCDWIFTTPAVVIQPLSGLWLMSQTGWDFTTSWILSALIVYGIVGMAWLPVVWIQIRMKQLVNVAVESNTELDGRYRLLQRWWEGLGYIGFGGALVIFYIMVAKVGFWS